MAFGKVDPQEVIGMTADELKGKLAKIDDFETKLAEFGTTAKAGQDSILAKLESLTAKPDDHSGDPDLDFLADPDKALTSRLKPLSDQTLSNTISLQHRAARESWPKDFERWGTEIVKKMAELNGDQQADPRVWKAMVLMVRGEHAADFEKDGAEGKFTYLEPVSAGLRSDPSKGDNLTSAEREMVKTLSPFGMTPDKYKNGKSRLEKARSARLGRFAEVA